MGFDVLHRRFGDHDAADRLACRAFWRQIHLSRLGRRVHRRLGAVRRRDEPHAAGALSSPARRMQRRARAARPGHPVYDLSARAPRLRDGDLQHRRDDGADHRSDPGRLADREFRLALVLLHQPAGRGIVRARHLRFHPPLPHDAARPVRRLRLCDAEPRRRLTAIDARPRPAQGLVPLDRNLDRGDDRRIMLLPVGRPHGDGRRALVLESRIIEEPEFRRRQPVDVRGRHDPQRHPGAHAVDDAGIAELPGVRRRVDDGAARVRHDAGDVSSSPA